MATNEKTVQVTLNLNPVVRQGNVATRTTVDKAMYDMKNIILQNVAFYVAKDKERALVANLRTTFSSIVETELARMGRQINALVIGLNDGATRSKGIGSGGAQSGPPGVLSITGGQSLALAGQLGPVSLVSGTGPWPARSAEYIRQKRKAGKGSKWFKDSGELGNYLRDPGTYLRAYGPVSVSFKKAGNDVALPAAVNVNKFQGGRRARRIEVGTVQVSVLGRITSDMLNDPGRRQPSPWRTGLFGALDGRMEERLLNRQDMYRPFLEHFLSYYLTRSIPNAVFRRVEKVVGVTARAHIGNRSL